MKQCEEETQHLTKDSLQDDFNIHQNESEICINVCCIKAKRASILPPED